MDHQILLRKAYLAGITGTLWLVLNDLHSNAQTSVKWCGELSRPFSIEQGVRQGGVISADLYKLYINDLLTQIQDTDKGTHIGIQSCAAPTCADDVAIVASNKIDLQHLVSNVEAYSNKKKI